MKTDVNIATKLLNQLAEAGGVDVDQNWDTGATTWTFPDGSQVRIEGDDYEIVTSQEQTT